MQLHNSLPARSGAARVGKQAATSRLSVHSSVALTNSANVRNGTGPPDKIFLQEDVDRMAKKQSIEVLGDVEQSTATRPFGVLNQEDHVLMDWLHDGVNEAGIVGQVLENHKFEVDGFTKHVILCKVGRARVYVSFRGQDNIHYGPYLHKYDPIMVTGQLGWAQLQLPGQDSAWDLTVNAATVHKFVDTHDQLLQHQAQHPDDFWACETESRSEYSPDYKHKYTGQSVWTSGSARQGDDQPEQEGHIHALSLDKLKESNRGYNEVFMNGTLLNLNKLETQKGKAYARAQLIPQGRNGGLALYFWDKAYERLQASGELVRNGTQVLVCGHISTWQREGGQLVQQVNVQEIDIYGQPAKELNNLQKWELLLEQPDKFWDNRPKKFSARSPDFRHKERRLDIALWLKDCPADLRDKVDAIFTA